LLVILLSLLPSRPAHAQSAPATAAYGSEIVTAWGDLVLELVRGTPGFSPPVASRAIGYWGLTLYESVAPGMPGYRSLAGELPGLQPLPLSPAGAELHWPVVASSASAAILRRLFANAGPTQMNAITALEQSVIDRYATTVAVTTLRQSVEQGRAVAAAIFAWSQTDGGHEGYRFNTPSSYKAPVGDSFWAPTPPKYGRALQPYWGENRTFAPALLERCRLPEPPPYATSPDSDLYQEAWTVYTTVRDLRPDQRLIALYWSDDPGTTSTPPGHSLAILTQILREQQSSLAAAAESYARVGMALSDAFVLAWATKYEYNQIRPITYIQRVIDPAGGARPGAYAAFPRLSLGPRHRMRRRHAGAHRPLWQRLRLCRPFPRTARLCGTRLSFFQRRRRRGSCLAAVWRHPLPLVQRTGAGGRPVHRRADHGAEDERVKDRGQS
jgi:hypothetical protein